MYIESSIRQLIFLQLLGDKSVFASPLNNIRYLKVFQACSLQKNVIYELLCYYLLFTWATLFFSDKLHVFLSANCKSLFFITMYLCITATHFFCILMLFSLSECQYYSIFLSGSTNLIVFHWQINSHLFL